jgi:hypothetical protein
VDDPDVVVRIDPYANRLSEHPVVGHRLRPQWIDFEARRLHGRFVLRLRGAVEHRLRDAEDDQEPDKTRTDSNRSVAHQLFHSEPHFRGQTTPWLSFVTGAIPL